MTNQKNRQVSPDGKWQITIDKDGNVIWFDLTKITGAYTIKEVLEATKKILPEIWQ
tara:strand:- start:2029 stop:2196 length:168 start_codon:yes stop_codon:yes gene_type:complete